MNKTTKVLSLFALPVLVVGLFVPAVSGAAKNPHLLEAAMGTINITAYGDLDGNRSYTPNANEGKMMFDRWYGVFGLDGLPIDHSRWCSGAASPWGGKLGGAGRASCRLPVGTYAVQMLDVDSDLYAGPQKTKYNTDGTNPVIVIVKNKQTHKVDFAYDPKGGNVTVRAFVDINHDTQYTQGEGAIFSWQSYRIASLNPGTLGKQIDYYRLCDNPRNNYGGAGRAYCYGVPPGLYVVWNDGENNVQHGQQIANQFNTSGVNPFLLSVYPGQNSTIDFGYESI